jgi:type I restriction enzyme S subunit
MATIGDISSLVTSGSTPLGGRKRYAQKGVPFIRSTNVLPGRLEIDPNVCIPQDVHREMSRSRVLPGDVLLNITGEGTLGRAAFVPDTVLEANINQHVCLIRPIPELVDPRYLAFILNSRQSQEQMARLQAGATRAALNHRLVRSLRIPLPPLEEQRRIVARIEEIAGKVEEIRSMQASTQKELHALLPAVLDKAFRGEL